MKVAALTHLFQTVGSLQVERVMGTQFLLHADEEACITTQDSTGAGAQLLARVIDGVVTAVYVIQGGVNYTAPTLTIGGGTGFTATLALTSGVITGVTITAGGQNYLTPRR